MSVSTVNIAENASVLDRLNRARELARVNGTESSDYFMDKCGAEAGDFFESVVVTRPSEPAQKRSYWAILFEGSWIERLLEHRNTH